jgi:hypothetical protein
MHNRAPTKHDYADPVHNSALEEHESFFRCTIILLGGAIVSSRSTIVIARGTKVRGQHDRIYRRKRQLTPHSPDVNTELIGRTTGITRGLSVPAEESLAFVLSTWIGIAPGIICGRIMAQPFDLQHLKVSGEPVPLIRKRYIHVDLLSAHVLDLRNRKSAGNPGAVTISVPDNSCF